MSGKLTQGRAKSRSTCLRRIMLESVPISRLRMATAAIILKATATTIPTRMETDSDFSDAAFLLSLVPDPMASAVNLSNPDRKQLRALDSLQDARHQAWRPLGRERTRLGQTSLDIMLNPES